MRVALLLVLAVVVVGCESLRAPQTVPPPVSTSGPTDERRQPTPPSPLPEGKGEQRQPNPLTPFPKKEGGAEPNTTDAKSFAVVLSPSPLRGGVGEGLQSQPAPPEDDALSHVTKCLERDDYLSAAAYLEGYVRRHVDQPMFRFQLAEMYLRAAHPAEAKCHLEQFVADAQTGPTALQSHLVTAHIKLREIAISTRDRFGESFHRGVGLVLLVREQDGDPKRDEGFCEEMLCKALRALTEAKEQRLGDSRVRMYLAEVHERTGNRHGASAERAAARADVVSGELTAKERLPLLLRE